MIGDLQVMSIWILLFQLIIAMLETLQELRNANNGLEHRIAVLTARRDQLLTISGFISDVHQSFLHQCLQVKHS